MLLPRGSAVVIVIFVILSPRITEGSTEDTVSQTRGGRGGGTPLYGLYRYVRSQKGRVFQLF